MKLIINNIKQALEESPEALKAAVAKKLKIRAEEIRNFRILKESVDARKKNQIQFVYSVLIETDGTIKLPQGNDVKFLEASQRSSLTPGTVKLSNRPIVIGTGPAGIFAGLILARHGFKPLIFERGAHVEERTEEVNRYWKSGKLNTETNVQFGEGGAGTFSDGKLTTRINDGRSEIVLSEFHRFGANEEILYKAKPHIGTDVLKEIVVNMRKEILGLGGEIRFHSKMTSLIQKEGRVTEVVINEKEKVPVDIVVLAIGHSARDTYQSLYDGGVKLIPKAFSIGVRIEHPQELINMAQYGKAAAHPRLGAADYQLFHKMADRTAYSFCMCPGGLVVASASEENTIVTNGMSESLRNRENANSALVVSVEPKDFENHHPLAGIEFQRKWEKQAFELGGKKGAAPVQRVGDFLTGNAVGKLGAIRPSYTGAITVANLNLCLPRHVTDGMKEAILVFDRKLRGFGTPDAILTGVETRTSAPVRIVRDEVLEAEGIKGLYPTGEGAGYAGGIVSAAVDGIRVAEQIIKTYRPAEE